MEIVVTVEGSEITFGSTKGALGVVIGMHAIEILDDGKPIAAFAHGYWKQYILSKSPEEQ